MDQKGFEPEFKGFIDFDSAFGIASADAPLSPQSSPQPSPHSPFQLRLSRISGPLFRIFFLYMIFLFAGYAVYFLFMMLSPSDPFSSGISDAAYALPAPVSNLISLFVDYHISIAAFLAFLNFAVSFADVYLSKKSLKTHLFSLLPPAAKSILEMTLIFVISMVIGFIFGHFYPEVFEDLFNLGGFPDDSPFGMMIYIFFNNTRIVFLMMFLGFIFGLLPAAVILVNGFTVGIVSEYMIKNESLAFLLTGLLPHGIIEIPIILLGAGIGFWSGLPVSRILLKRDSFDAAFKKNFINATWVFFLIAVPLLFIAAVIEVYVTSPLLSALFP